MRIIQTTASILLLCGLACHAESPQEGVHSRLFFLAGSAGIDCGRSSTKEEMLKSNVCAQRAFKNKNPFFVQYRIQGTDAIIEEGLALNKDGQLFHVSTIALSPLFGNKPSGKLETHVCQPSIMRTLLDNELTCDFPQD